MLWRAARLYLYMYLSSGAQAARFYGVGYTLQGPTQTTVKRVSADHSKWVGLVEVIFLTNEIPF